MREQQIYDFIKAYMTENGYPPSEREIGDGVGLKSTSSVHSYLERMVLKGLLVSDNGSSRTTIIKGARYVFDGEDEQR
jgi:repressor LexA